MDGADTQVGWGFFILYFSSISSAVSATGNYIKKKITILHEDINKRILGYFYKVFNKISDGFLKKVFENALIIKLVTIGCAGLHGVEIRAFFERKKVANYFADILQPIKLL